MINLVRKINIEDYKNIYVVGDIHGCFTLLEKLLYSIGFDKERDLLICVGDLVGRGAESYMAVDYLKKDWFTTVVGNHDLMFFDYGDFKFKQFYAQMDKVEHDLTLKDGWVEEFAGMSDQVSFFIEIYKEGEILDLINHSAFHLYSIDEYYAMKDDYIKDGDHTLISIAIWDRAMAFSLELNNKDRMSGNTDDLVELLDVKGIRNIYTGHNIIFTPEIITDIKERAKYLEYGNVKFLDTGAFFTDKDYAIGMKLPDTLDFGFTIYNVTKNKFERICYK